MKNHSAKGADEASGTGSGAMEEYGECPARSVVFAVERQVGSAMYSCHRSLIKHEDFNRVNGLVKSPILSFCPQINFPTTVGRMQDLA